jgi:hypothetical protein
MSAPRKPTSRRKAVPTLPPLRVRITRNGKTVRIVKIPDPRIGFCLAYNSLGGDTHAEPVVSRSRKGGAV